MAIPAGYDDDLGMFLRYLQCEKYDCDKAMQEIIEHDEWQRKTFPINPEGAGGPSWYGLMNSGFIYVAKRDKKGRPIIVINVEKLIQANPE